MLDPAEPASSENDHPEHRGPGATVPPGSSHGRGLKAYPWLIYLVPLVVYLVVGSFEPGAEDAPGGMFGIKIPYSAYPGVYSLKIVATLFSVWLLWPGSLPLPIRVEPLAFGVGVLGVVLWIGLTKLGLEAMAYQAIGWEGYKRTGFDLIAHARESGPIGAGFLAVRLLGLALVVPLVEELFWRGFVMRIAVDADWWRVPLATFTPLAVAAGVLIPAAMHPAELIAAVVWFSLVMWLFWRTGNLWDCVAAHATTNALLGVWVFATGDWYFL